MPDAPISPGETLRRARGERITQAEFAEAIGMTDYMVNQIENDRQSITPETALLIGAATGTRPEFWLDLQRAVDLSEARRSLGEKLRQVPVVAPVAAASDTPQTRHIVLGFPVTLTPQTRRPARDSLYRAIDEFGLAPASAQLLREAARIERLADRNERCGRDAGAAYKRRFASRLRRAAGVA